MLVRLLVVLAVIAVLIGAGAWFSRVAAERTELKNEIVRLQKLADDNAKLAEHAREAEQVAFEKLTEVSRNGEERSRALQAEIERTQGALRACRIDARTLRVLNRPTPGMPGAAPTPADDRSAGATVEAGPGTTCEAVVVTFDENHKQYDALAVQLTECQSFYRKMRSEYCALTQAC